MLSTKHEGVARLKASWLDRLGLPAGILAAALMFGGCRGAEREAPASSPDPPLGGSLYYTGGTVVVTVEPAEAAYQSILGLYDEEGERLLQVATNRDLGRSVAIDPSALGHRRGDELIFGIRIADTGESFLIGPGTRNPDGLPHARVVLQESGGYLVGFEDLLGGGDRDYDDNVFLFVGGLRAEADLESPPGSEALP